ncbi:MAG TPA: restriction endonuclease [Nitrospirota bacterium]|nr:restriction endonuclease [Nitrospirota bacterium]
MARQKTSPLEDLILVVSKLPWWIGVLLALVSYLVLHIIASRPALTISNPGQMGVAAVRSLMSALAMFGQYILPLIFGTAALVSVINSIKQKKLYDRVESRFDVAAFNEMSWDDFERLVGEYYERNGFQVTREGSNGPDGGVDLVLCKNGETHLVQCKQWKAYKVGVQPVREFYGVMAARGAAGGYFVTSGVYTEAAQEFVRGLNVDLIDGSKLRNMIDTARKKPSALTIKDESRQATIIRVCPKCGAEMKKRVGRLGSTAGKEFWGCIAFPKCNGTRPLEDSVSAGIALTVSQKSAASVPEKKN